MSQSFPEMSVKDSVNLEKAVLYWLGDDVLKIQFREHIDMDRDDIVRLQEPKARLAAGREYYMLIISPKFANVSKEAREYSATPEANVGAIAKAIVTRSLGLRLIVSFFISVNKPPIPHRIFGNEADALRWIAELRAKTRIR